MEHAAKLYGELCGFKNGKGMISRSVICMAKLTAKPGLGGCVRTVQPAVAAIPVSDF